MLKVIVYGLATSADGRIRYVGQTNRSMQTRLREHLRWARDGKKSALFSWIRKHEGAGERIIMFPIERNAVWNETEIRLISFYRRAGSRLVNATSGGKGIVGLARSVEHQTKIADAQRGKKRGPLSEAQKKHLSDVLKTRTFTEEHRRRISEKRKAQGISLETQKKMAEGRVNSQLWRSTVGRKARS